MSEPKWGKVVRCGDKIRVYSYENAVFIGKDDKAKGFDSKDRERSEEMEDFKARRARQNICDIIDTNVTDISKFVTLTYKENQTDLSVALDDFKKFMKRLNYYAGHTIKYLTIFEFQKRGAVHFHCVFFDMQYMHFSQLKKIWGHGNIDIKKLDSHINIGRYMCKYITKDMTREKGRKRYMCSRNIIRPEIKYYKSSEDIDLNDYLLTYTSTYFSEYQGDINYAEFILEKNKGVF